MSPDYTYFLDGAQVFPSGDWSIDVKPAWESLAFCRDYRRMFNGELIFTDTDYDIIRTSYECCESMEIVIKCDEVDYWTGIIGFPLDFVFDEDLCQVVCTPRTQDKYSCFDIAASLEADLGISPFQFCFEKTNICSDQWRDKRSIWLLRRSALVTNSWLRQLLWNTMLRGGCPNIVPPIGTYDIYSTFFLNDFYPDGTNPYPVNNYVTGFANKLNYLIVSPAEEVFDNVGWAWDQTVYNISWNNAMTFLHNMFNVWWYIDEENHIRIEHIWFFLNYFGVSYNLTVAAYSNWILNSSKFEYLKDSLPYREEWNWADFHSDLSRILTDFYPQLIDYDCQYHPAGFFSKEYGLSKYSTDIEYVSPDWVANNPTNVSGLMILRCVPDTVPTGIGKTPTQAWCVWDSMGAISGNQHLNAHLSPANLHVNYWTWDRPYWTGTMIGAAVNFNSAEYIKKQTKFFFPVCCDDIEFLEFLTSQYGNGIISSGNIKNGNFHLELLFENDCEEEPDPTVWPDKECY